MMGSTVDQRLVKLISFDIRQETWTTWGELDWLDDKTRMHKSADIDRCLVRESILEEFEECGQSNS
jgi:hypothetical protein